MSKCSYVSGVQLSRILAGQKHAPVVYFARIGDNVKIGTTTNLKARMRGLYLSLDDVLVIVAGGADVEAACHQRFAGSRHPDYERRELFCMHGPLSDYLHSLHVAAVQASQEAALPAGPPEIPAATAAGEPSVTPGAITLRDAVAARYFGTRNLEAIRSASKRDRTFPRPLNTDPTGFLYDSQALCEYTARKAHRR